VSGVTLLSVGYAGRTVDELVHLLQQHSVTTLVDVRLTPLSRKPGLSKRGLGAALEAAGIEYVHLRALGNPKDNRAAMRAGDPRSFTVFRRGLASGPGVEAVRHVAERLESRTVALLCVEREHEACHRHVVAEELQRAVPDLAVVQL
jgi:uncharacterized protein (DUF488 family)